MNGSFRESNRGGLTPPGNAVARRPQDAYDVLVTTRDFAPEAMIGRRLAIIGLGLFAAAGHPAAAAAPRSSLDGLPVIRSSGAFADVDVSIWSTALRGGHPVLASSRPLAQQEAAAAGLGIALLPVGHAEADARLARVAYGPVPSSEIWMLASRAVLRQSRVRSFVRWCRRYYAGSAPHLAVDRAA